MGEKMTDFKLKMKLINKCGLYAIDICPVEHVRGILLLWIKPIQEKKQYFSNEEKI